MRLGQVVRVRAIRAHDRIDHRDIIVFKAPAGTDPAINELAKRVIGLPGETVSAKGGHVYVDGKELAELYLAKGTTTSNFAPVVVPGSTYWVMGDRRGNSVDSRVFGPILRADIIGFVQGS